VVVNAIVVLPLKFPHSIPHYNRERTPTASPDPENHSSCRKIVTQNSETKNRIGINIRENKNTYIGIIQDVQWRKYYNKKGRNSNHID
jgi:hypothetical protein